MSLWISASPKPACAQAPLRASCCTKNHVIWPRTEQVMAFSMKWHRACAMCTHHRGVHQASKPCPTAFSRPSTLDVRAAAVWGSSTLSKVVVLTCKKMHTSRIGGCMCCSAPPRPPPPPHAARRLQRARGENARHMLRGVPPVPSFCTSVPLLAVLCCCCCGTAAVLQYCT